MREINIEDNNEIAVIADTVLWSSLDYSEASSDDEHVSNKETIIKTKKHKIKHT